MKVWFIWLGGLFLYLLYSFSGLPFFAMNLFQIIALISNLDALLETIDAELHLWVVCPRSWPGWQRPASALLVLADSRCIQGWPSMYLCRYYQKKYNLRYKYCFYGSDLPLCIIVVIIYLWIHVSHVFKLHACEVISNHTVTDWFNLCRDVCPKYLITHPIKLGGMVDIVKIDKTKLARKHKYSRGRVDRYLNMWLFTLIEQGPQYLCAWSCWTGVLTPCCRCSTTKSSMIHSNESRSYWEYS